MAAGLGLKTFVTGDVLTAADTNGYLMQGVWVFASAAARSAAVTSPQEGNFSFLKDTNSTEYYDGAAWVSVAGGASALTKIGTYPFTAAAALNVNNAFSATYKRYLLLVRAKAASGADYLYLKFRVGGVDSSTAYYYSLLESSYTGGASANIAVNNGTAGVSMVYADTSYVTGAVFNVFNPFEATQTNYFKQSDSVGRGAANYSTSQGTGVHLAATSYDGFSLVSASGTYTGEVVVYGYAN